MSSSTDLAAFQPARFGLGVQAEEVRAEARAAGYAAGWAEGRRAAVQQADAELSRLQQEDFRQRQAARARADAAVSAAVQDWTRRTTPVIDELADLVVDAAIQVAEAVIGRELGAIAPADRARVALRRALAPLVPGSPVRLRMNPQDLAALDEESTLDATTGTGAAVAHEGHLVELVADATLRSGDAVAEQDGATVDARVSSALARARSVVAG